MKLTVLIAEISLCFYGATASNATSGI